MQETCKAKFLLNDMGPLTKRMRMHKTHQWNSVGKHMAKRLRRSLASELWETDDFEFQEMNAHQETKIEKLLRENANLLEKVAQLEKENSVLKIPKPLPTAVCRSLQSRSDLLRSWPNQKWLSNLGEEVVKLPRLWEEILPQLHDSNNCAGWILFDLTKSPKATASTVLRHAEDSVGNLFKTHPAVYKIGISSNPVKRWNHSLYGYGLDKRERWLGMKILAACDSAFGAAMIESALIRLFQNSPGCRNDRPGGETPSPNAGPHFTYVVYNILLPPQKVVSHAHAS